MSSESQGLVQKSLGRLMRGAMATLVTLVIARLVLELVGVPQNIARYVSSTVGLLLVAIYVAAVGPLRGGLRKSSQLVLPALVLSVWTEAWIILVTIIAAVLRLSRSHFAEQEDFGNWGHLGRHVLGHIVETAALFVIVLLLMMMVHTMWRWPITVAPGALLGVFVIMRFWTEVMGLEPLRTAAWSSTLLVLLSAFYLGGVGARMGLTRARQLFVPSLVLGWAWRFWVYLATLFAAVVPFFKTHFFDVSRGNIPMRLGEMLVGSIVEGFIAGLLVWGIAVWTASATQPGGAASSGDSQNLDA